METTASAAAQGRDERPRTSLILLPLLMVLVGILAGVLGKQLGPLMTGAAVQLKYREADEAFFQEAKAFYAQNAVAEGVVSVPPGQEVYLLAQQWAYIPELRLKAGAPYTFWVASADVPHGFTLREQGLNFMLVPGYVYQVELTFDKPGQYVATCTEYCGLGHETMFGRIIVEP